jgi:AraC-like DNA-binding protein
VNLRPGYREFAPPAALRDTVACVWVRIAGEGGEVRIVPDACADVVWRQGYGATVAGPDTSAKLVTIEPGETLVGLRFLPGAGHGGLGVPLDELRDLRVDAADVDRAFAVDGDRTPREVAEQFVAVAAGRRPDPLVRHAAVRVTSDGVAALARDLGVSERQLRRRFHAAVGYGPTTLARVLRFRRAVRALDAGRTDLAGIAFDAGFADQAHLTRECTRLAGLPPAALMRARGARPPA